MRATDAALLIVALCVGWSLYRAHRSDGAAFAQFNLLDLIMENGRVSRIACVFLGSFAVTSWIMIRLTMDGKMTEGYLTSFGALWIIPLTAKLFSPAPITPNAKPGSP